MMMMMEMLKVPIEKQVSCKTDEYLSRKMETLRNNQMEILEIKNTVTELKKIIQCTQQQTDHGQGKNQCA